MGSHSVLLVPTAQQKPRIFVGSGVSFLPGTVSSSILLAQMARRHSSLAAVGIISMLFPPLGARTGKLPQSLRSLK